MNEKFILILKGTVFNLRVEKLLTQSLVASNFNFKDPGEFGIHDVLRLSFDYLRVEQFICRKHQMSKYSAYVSQVHFLFSVTLTG